MDEDALEELLNEADEEERALEAFLFPNDASLIPSPLPETEEEDSFVVDKGGEAEVAKPAWKDADDDKFTVNIEHESRLRKLRTTQQEKTITGTEYTQRLRTKFEALSQNTEWAKLPTAKRARVGGDEDSDGEDPLDAVLQSTGALLASPTELQPQNLSVTRVRDANVRDPCEAVVQSIGWHPNGKLLMTAGQDKTIRLFEIDGEHNPKAQAVFLNDLPILQASFTPDGSQIIASGRRKYFYTFDLNQGAAHKVPGIKGRAEKSLENFILSPDGNNITFFGNDGTLLMVDMRSKNWIANLKMNGSLRAADYSGDSLDLYSFGGEGQVYLWDVRTRRCRQKFFDEGCVQGTSLAVAKSTVGPQYLAAGSNSGVVNLYDRANLHDARPSPLKPLSSITVPVDCMTFSHDSQLFAWSASCKKQCLRVAHVASRTIYSNWPTGKTPLGHVSCLAFSPNSGYLAVGNHKGRVLLYRLNHFGSV